MVVLDVADVEIVVARAISRNKKTALDLRRNWGIFIKMQILSWLRNLRPEIRTTLRQQQDLLLRIAAGLLYHRFSSRVFPARCSNCRRQSRSSTKSADCRQAGFTFTNNSRNIFLFS